MTFAYMRLKKRVAKTTQLLKGDDDCDLLHKRVNHVNVKISTLATRWPRILVCNLSRFVSGEFWISLCFCLQ